MLDRHEVKLWTDMRELRTRIKDLHKDLGITTAQQTRWGRVAQTMRENAGGSTGSLTSARKEPAKVVRCARFPPLIRWSQPCQPLTFGGINRGMELYGCSKRLAYDEGCFLIPVDLRRARRVSVNS